MTALVTGRAGDRTRVSLAAGDVRIPVHHGVEVPAPRYGDQPYPPGPGTDRLRAAVVEATPGQFAADGVLVTPGARVAILALLHTMLTSGSRVLIPMPYWPTYPVLVRAAGGEPVFVPGRVGDGDVDLPALESRVDAQTRVLILNSPRNPDGARIDRDCLRRLVSWAGERGLSVIFDQVYRGIPAAAGPAASVLDPPGALPGHVAVVDGLTKRQALAGLRVGWAIGEPSLIRRAAAVSQHLFGGTCTIAQDVAAGALATAPPDGLARVLDANRLRAHARLAALPGVTCTLPAGGMFLFPDLRQWLASAAPAAAREDLAGWLRDRLLVEVGDGAAYGAPGHIRLSFALPPDQLDAGIDRIVAAVEGRDG